MRLTPYSEQLVAQFARATTLAELSTPVMEAWIDNLNEPIEILTVFGPLEAAAWLALIDDRPPDDTRTALLDRARAVARYAPLEPATTFAMPVG